MELFDRLKGYFYRRSVARIRGIVRVFVLGNQKTGSTVIAASLSRAAKQSVTLDIKGAIRRPEWKALLSQGIGSFDGYLHQHRREFYSSIVKEPGLTFFYPELRERFPDARYVMVVRHPMDNIRSILNRLGIPGNLSELKFEDYPKLLASPAWRLNLDGSWLGINETHYIEVLARRWLLCANTYLDAADRFYLLKYEEFCGDKVGEIERLSLSLGMCPEVDIADYVDRQFQSAGEKIDDYVRFFGPANCQRIRAICLDAAGRLGYELK